MVGWTSAATPTPVPAAAMVPVIIAGRAVEPIDVKLFDDNQKLSAEVAIERDGGVDDGTAIELKHLFRDWRHGGEKPVHKKTLAMLADVAEHWGKPIDFVSVVRLGRDEEWESPHRKALAIDFRIRGVALSMIRDYIWKKYTDVGVGWYPNEGFIHMDTRPAGIHDTAWTFLRGHEIYHPYWAELARMPVKPVLTPHKPGV
jgi:uncharacterized protein YcbK (DUF882 family)